jgi:hypothetical protein
LKSYGSFHPANDVRPPHQPGRIAESTYIAEPQLDGWRRYIHRGQRWHRRNLEETFDALRHALVKPRLLCRQVLPYALSRHE